MTHLLSLLWTRSHIRRSSPCRCGPWTSHSADTSRPWPRPHTWGAHRSNLGVVRFFVHREVINNWCLPSAHPQAPGQALTINSNISTLMTFPKPMVSMELTLKSLSSSHAPWLLHFLHSGVRSSTFLASPFFSGNLGSCVILWKKGKKAQICTYLHEFKIFTCSKTGSFTWSGGQQIFMIFLSVSKPQDRVWLEGALELSRMVGQESRVTHSERVPSPGRSMPEQKSSANYTVYSQQLVTSGFIFQKYRYIARKRRRFKTTQNTFDKMWRRLTAALEY